MEEETRTIPLYRIRIGIPLGKYIYYSSFLVQSPMVPDRRKRLRSLYRGVYRRSTRIPYPTIQVSVTPWPYDYEVGVEVEISYKARLGSVGGREGDKGGRHECWKEKDGDGD